MLAPGRSIYQGQAINIVKSDTLSELMMNQTFLKWITKAFKSIISNDPDRGLFVLLRNCYDL